MNLFANLIIDLTALITVCLLYVSGRNMHEKELSQKLFGRMLISMGGYLVADAVAWIIDGRFFSGSRVLQMALNTVIYLTQIMYAYFWLLYTDFWLFRSEERLKRLKWLYLLPLLIEAALMAANVFTGWIFVINDTGLYERGPLFLLCMLAFYGYDAYALCLSLREFFAARDWERKKYCLWLAGFIVLPILASLVLALFVYGLSIVAPFYALSLLMVYLNVHQKRLVDERQRLVQREAELQKANAAIMISQLQPHFLYNALSTITVLCDEDPKMAKTATVEFARFLRGNLGSLSADKPEPFDRELEHTKNYLALEQLRFCERLNVVYDIQTTDFQMPPLTLQPIVENAVHYGVTKQREGGTVTVASRETDAAYVLTVTDDGVGFDPTQKKEDGLTHIGIDNVRDRLARMSGGTLEISSTPGAGTVAVIKIPKRFEKKA